MWRLDDRPCRWLWLDDEPTGLTVLHGLAADPRPVHRGVIVRDAWLPTWDRYLAASDAARDAPFATFGGATADRVAAAQRELVAACTAMYELVATAAACDLGSERFVTARGDRVRDLALARVVAVGRPDLLARRHLPWDLATGVTRAQAAQLAEVVPRRRLPATDRLTIIAPRELELERVVEAAGAEVELAYAWAARWLVELEVGLAAARAAGATVIRPATARDLMAALDGFHGDCLQLVAHTSNDGKVFLDGERVLLPALEAVVRDRVAAGWCSPVRSVDLATCRSEGRLGRLLRSTGIEYVSGWPTELHIGAIARFLRVLYQRRIFDGATPFAHAWLVAALQEAG